VKQFSGTDGQLSVNMAIVLKNHPSTSHGDFSPKADIVDCNKEDEMTTVKFLLRNKSIVTIATNTVI